jgi:hypothetical protein
MASEPTNPVTQFLCQNAGLPPDSDLAERARQPPDDCRVLRSDTRPTHRRVFGRNDHRSFSANERESQRKRLGYRSLLRPSSGQSGSGGFLDSLSACHTAKLSLVTEKKLERTRRLRTV